MISRILSTPTLQLQGSQEEEKGPGKVSEKTIAGKIPNMGKKTLKFRKCRVPYRINTGRNAQRHIPD